MEEQSFREFITCLSDREARKLSGACHRREAPKFSAERECPGNAGLGKLVINNNIIRKKKKKKKKKLSTSLGTMAKKKKRAKSQLTCQPITTQGISSDNKNSESKVNTRKPRAQLSP